MEIWKRTDDYQLVQEITPDIFNVIDPTFLPGKNETVLLYKIEVNITEYQNEANQYITSYGYNSLAQMEATYGHEWKQIFAECIAEQVAHTEGDLVYEGSPEGAEKWISSNYANGIAIY